MMFCQECGVQLRTAARFCNQCGSPVRQQFNAADEALQQSETSQVTAEPSAVRVPASRSTLATPADATERHLHRPSAPLGAEEFSFSTNRPEVSEFSEPAFFTTALPRTVNRRHNRLVITTGLMLLAFIVLLVVFYFFAAKYA